MMTLMTFWIIPIILLKIKVQVQKEVTKKTIASLPSSDHDDNTDNLQSKSTSIKKSYKKKQKETDAPPSQIISELLKDDDILNDDGLNDGDDGFINDGDDGLSDDEEAAKQEQ
jgi:hypothetical protein